MLFQKLNAQKHANMIKSAFYMLFQIWLHKKYVNMITKDFSCTFKYPAMKLQLSFTSIHTRGPCPTGVIAPPPIKMLKLAFLGIYCEKKFGTPRHWKIHFTSLPSIFLKGSKTTILVLLVNMQFIRLIKGKRRVRLQEEE